MDNSTSKDERAQLIATLQGAAAGDRIAFHELYRRTCAKLLGVCLRIFPDRGEAEDALQDVYVTIWLKAGQYDPARASPITWLVALARNRAIDRLRARGGRITTPIESIPEPADGSASALESLLETERGHRIVDCLDELARDDAALIRTAFYDGATYAELAERAAVPLGTVKSRIRRALLRLRECLA